MIKMMSTRKSCRNRPDVFCYICGEYTLVPYRNPITTFIKQTCHTYFGMKLGDQDKAWAPHMVCKSCTECLRQWSKGKKTSLKFGIPMLWREPRNHVSDCYFCAIDVTGINRKNREVLKYPNLESARRPVAHYDEFPVPVYAMLSDDSDNCSIAAQESQEDEEADFSDDTPHPFSQNELNDLVCDLDLSKSSSELLAFRLKEKTSCLMAHASLFIATGIKSSFIFSLRKKICFTAQILFIFCKSLEYHIMNPEIRDYSSTAARDHLNVFCSIMATSLL